MLLVFSLLLCVALSYGSEAYVIKEYIANLKAEPKVTAETVTQAQCLDPVVILKDGAWCLVSLSRQQNYQGYIEKNKLINWNHPHGQAYVVSVKNLALRDKPNGKLILSLPFAAPVTVISELGDYFRIATYKGLLYAKKSELRPLNGNPIQAKAMIATAKGFLGVPYLWGGVGPNGFDCSGFTWAVAASYGWYIPRDAKPQYLYEQFIAIDRNKLLPGDLVFFTTYKEGPSHVGIYIGNGQFINAASSTGITIASLDSPYYKERYLGARRMPFVIQ